MSELVPLLNVEDVSASVEFYQRTLSAELENQWENEGRVRWARIRFDGGSLMLNQPDGASSSERRARTEFSDAVLYLFCDDAAGLRERFEASDLAVGPMSEEDYGNHEFALRDPDGYVIRFSSPR